MDCILIKRVCEDKHNPHTRLKYKLARLSCTCFKKQLALHAHLAIIPSPSKLHKYNIEAVFDETRLSILGSVCLMKKAQRDLRLTYERKMKIQCFRALCAQADRQTE